MRKIFINKFVGITLAAIALGLFSAPAALADYAQFNTAGGDYPTLQVADYTRNPGSSAYWSTAVSANSADVISFMVFYHNTSAGTATNTRIKLNLPSIISNGTAVTATVSSDNSNTASGTVYVYLPNGGSVSVSEIPGSATWYQNSYSTPTVWQYGETGDEIVNFPSGVNLGSISPNASGFVVVRAQLGGAVYPYTNQTTYAAVTPFSGNVVYGGSGTATLSGVVTPNNSTTTAWFEYGPTTSFGYTTPSQTFPASGYSSNYSYTLTNLSPNMTYYYRAVASNSGGTSYGTVYSFSTGATNTSYVAGVPSNVNVTGLSSMLTSLRTLLADMKSQNQQANAPATVASASAPSTSNNLGANILSALGGGTVIIAFLVLIIIGIGAFFFVRFILK